MATLFNGAYQDWDLGLQFSMNLGFRRELAAVRNAQLQLARRWRCCKTRNWKSSTCSATRSATSTATMP